MVDIKEFVFRAMHGTQTGRLLSSKPNMVEVPRSNKTVDLLKDPEAVAVCARFLYEEIYHEGEPPANVQFLGYNQQKWFDLAEEFIQDIIPSDTFMLDALTFFEEIRRGVR